MSNKKSDKLKYSKKKVIKNLLVCLGVIILSLIIVWLMKYFFVEKSNIKINMSTDKKVEYITINNKDELMTTQKYVSDLGYKMRYDISNVQVSKYNSQDIYKFKNAEKIIILIEKASLPNSCNSTTNLYSTACFIKVDSYTKEYYLQSNNKTFKITVRTPNITENNEKYYKRINYMLDTFEITK